MLQRNATNSSSNQVPTTPSAWDSAIREFRALPGRTAGDALRCEAAVDLLGRLHRELLATAPEYRTALDEALSTSTPPTGSGWSWTVLVDNPLVRSGLLGIYSGYPIPAHDHPGSRGALFVLTGRIRVSWLTVQSRLPGDLTELRQVAQQDCDVGETALIDDGERNIHQVAALSERCLTLNLLIPPFLEAQRSWYLPIIDTEPDVVVARRLSANALRRTTAQ